MFKFNVSNFKRSPLDYKHFNLEIFVALQTHPNTQGKKNETKINI